MKMTRERKIIGTVLGLALAGLLADRTLFGGSPSDPTSSSSSASLLVSASERGAAPITSSVNAAPQRSRSMTLDVGVAGAGDVARRLEQLAQRRSVAIDAVVDVFHAAWRVDHTVQTVSTEPTAEIVRIENARKAFSKHKLTSLIGGGRGGAAAMIDGKYLRVGQQLEGYTLVAVDNQSVTFAQAGIRVQINLEGVLNIWREAGSTPQLAVTPLSAP